MKAVTDQFWNGVLPALTTPFAADGTVDHDFLGRHAQLMIEAGCTGVVALGSLGEAATLSFDEKCAILETLRRALNAHGHGTPGALIAGIAALSTTEAVALARKAELIGCDGLMILPPYVYSSDWREMRAHVSAVIAATKLPCMLYNNPIAYRTDFLPEQVQELANIYPNLVAVKESSADVRRVTAIRRLLSDRLLILVGVDDIIVEGIAAGASGWVAGLAVAFPRESVKLFDLARAGKFEELRPLYEWFLPLLTLDTVPKFVQLIKLTQSMVGMGTASVRAPRLELVDAELASAKLVIETALATRPEL